MLLHLETCRHVAAEVKIKASQEMDLRGSRAYQRRSLTHQDQIKENIPPSTVSSFALSPATFPTTSSYSSTPVSSTSTPSITRAPSLTLSSDSLELDPVEAATASTPTTTRPVKRRRTEAGLDVPFYGETQQPQPWPEHIQQQFQADLCRLIIACNIAWWAVDHPFFRYFFGRWMPEALLPGRKVLSGRILETEAQRILAEMKTAVGHRYATGQSDGWKNVSRTSLQASVINVEYTVSVLHGCNLMIRIL